MAEGGGYYSREFRELDLWAIVCIPREQRNKLRLIPWENALYYSWDHESRGMFMKIMDDAVTCERECRGGQLCTGIRAKIGHNSGIHVWSFEWLSKYRGSISTIGIASRNASRQSRWYEYPVGFDARSCGWDLYSNRTVHKMDSINQEIMRRPTYPVENFFAPDIIHMIVDLDKPGGHLAFASRGQYYGPAFPKIEINHWPDKEKRVFPIMATSLDGTRVSMRYLATSEEIPPILSCSPYPQVIEVQETPQVKPKKKGNLLTRIRKKLTPKKR